MIFEESKAPGEIHLTASWSISAPSRQLIFSAPARVKKSYLSPKTIWREFGAAQTLELHSPVGAGRETFIERLAQSAKPYEQFLAKMSQL